MGTSPVNETVEARAKQLMDSINDLLMRMEIPGCYTGIASLMFLRLGFDHECDREYCVLTHEQAPQDNNPARNRQLNLATLNNGVQLGSRVRLTAAHTEDDVAFTGDALGNALTDVRDLGLA